MSFRYSIPLFIVVTSRFFAASPPVAPAAPPPLTDEMRAALALGLEPVATNVNPSHEYSDEVRDYAMVIGIDRTPKGRLWAAWVAGGDSEKGLFVAATSDDNGGSWSKPRLVIDPVDAPNGLARRALVGNFWTDPTGRLWLFYDQSMGYFDGRGGAWTITCDNSDDEKPVWSAPRRIWHGMTLNKPVVLKNGEWLMPISLWTRDKIRPKEIAAAFPELDEHRMAHVFVGGPNRDWQRRGGVRIPDSQFDEHMMVELRDGRLWMLARTTYGIAETFSADQGRTWSAPQPSRFGHVPARFHLRRLASGRLLFVKHGTTPEEKTKSRSHLTAFLSDDDGTTWSTGLLLDERTGVSYPDGFQAPDGTLFIIYDHNRARDREILLARFNEADVLAGKFESKNARPRMMVSKATGEAKK